MLSLYSGYDRTEIVLSQGLGKHTIMGLNLDSSLEKVIQQISIELIKSLTRIEGLNGKIDLFSREAQIPPSFFESLKSLQVDQKSTNQKFPEGGQLLSILARYGDPDAFDLPTPLLSDFSADMSFTGLSSIALSFFFK